MISTTTKSPSAAGIPLYRLMDTKGQMRSDGASYDEAATWRWQSLRDCKELTIAEADALNLVPEELRGLDRFEARKKVVEQITAEGLAVMVTKSSRTRRARAKPALCPMSRTSRSCSLLAIAPKW